MCDALHSLQTQPQSTRSRELGTGRYLARETSTKDPGGVEPALDGGGGSAELEARLEGALAQLAALQVLCGGAWPRAAIERCRHPSHNTFTKHRAPTDMFSDRMVTDREYMLRPNVHGPCAASR